MRIGTALREAMTCLAPSATGGKTPNYEIHDRRAAGAFIVSSAHHGLSEPRLDEYKNTAIDCVEFNIQSEVDFLRAAANPCGIC
ncbi:hypothetical protein ACQR1R_10090 [Bradyrhizobium oligotrophicum]